MTEYKWRITLFGSLCLLHEDEVVCTFPPSKGGSLFAYLVCHLHRAHTRQELAERFWPEADNSVGRTRLRQHLALLRRQLEPEGIPPGSILLTKRDEIALNPSAFTTDVAVFENAIQRAEQTTDTDECTALLERAIGLYRGELLSGYYDHWILAERERLKARVLDVLRERAAGCDKAKDTARSLDYLQRLVAADPLREESHLLLIHSLMADNQTAAARRQYKTLERLLKTELDHTPSEATRSLIASLFSDTLLDLQKADSNAVQTGSSQQSPGASYAVITTEASSPPIVQESDLAPSFAPSQAESSVTPLPVSVSPNEQSGNPLVLPHTDQVWNPLTLSHDKQAGNPLTLSLEGEGRVRVESSNHDKPNDPDEKPISAPTAVQKRYPHHIALVGGSLVTLLAILFLFQGWLQRPDTNPAHRNFSPAVKQGKPPDELWIRRYEPKPGDLDSEPTAMVVDKAGNIYVTGFINTTKTDVDYITLKYASDGRILWEQRYNGVGNDVDRAWSIAVDSDGSVYVTGESMGKTGHGPGELNELDIVTLKYDANGKKIGEDCYDGPGHGRDNPVQVAPDGKGHVYVLGREWDDKPTSGGDGHGMVLMQYDRNLKRNWIRHYYDEKGGAACGDAMVIDPAGMLYVTGESGNGLITLKYDADGTLLGTDLHTMPKDINSRPLRILLGEAGSLYVASQVSRRIAQSPQEQYAIQVLKYDSALHLVWEHTFWEAAGDFRGSGTAVSGSVYITGTAYGDGQPYSQGLLRVREDGAQFGLTPFAGAPRGSQHGFSMTVDHRRMLHITGQGHFTDTEKDSPYLGSTEITTTTFDSNGSLYRVHRYAGSDLLRSMGGKVIAVDEQDNILVAGQTFDGKINDLVLLKYPP